jgi:hypothetical protein
MNYFRKTKFRESSLIIVALFIAIVYFTTNTISVEQDKAVQEIIDARVEEAVEEALKEVTTTAVTLSQTEAYAQNNTLDQLVSTETWYLFDADPPKSNYPEDLRRIEVLQTKLSDIYPEVQITSIYDEQTYQYHEKYCKEYNITECSLPYISDEHSYVTTTLPQPLIPDFSNPKVYITNCPTEVINADFYEIEWTIDNEGGDVVYIGILVRKDNANITRVFFTKEDNADLITFPETFQKISYSYQIDNIDSNVAASYVIEINAISEQANGHSEFGYDLCSIDYSP